MKVRDPRRTTLRNPKAQVKLKKLKYQDKIQVEAALVPIEGKSQTLAKPQVAFIKPDWHKHHLNELN